MNKLELMIFEIMSKEFPERGFTSGQAIMCACIALELAEKAYYHPFKNKPRTEYQLEQFEKFKQEVL